MEDLLFFMFFLKAPVFEKLLKWPWSCQKLTNFKIDQKGSYNMSLGVLGSNLTKNSSGNCPKIVT